MSIVDDYGRYEANPQLLRSKCYPLQTDAVRVADITRWMAACQKAGLILDYAVQGKQYVVILNFQQQQRSVSKFPDPSANDNIGNHLLADAKQPLSNDSNRTLVSYSNSYSKTDSGAPEPRAKSANGKHPIPEDWTPKPETVAALSAQFKSDATVYVAPFVDACRAKDYRYKDFDAAFRNCVRQDWPKIRQNQSAKATFPL